MLALSLAIPTTISTTTPTPSTTSESMRSAAAAPRGRPRRAAPPTSGEATAATTAAVITGVTIVEVSEASQTTPTSRTVTPTRNHDVKPRSLSQRGVVNSPVRLVGSTSTPPPDGLLPSSFIARTYVPPSAAASPESGESNIRDPTRKQRPPSAVAQLAAARSRIEPFEGTMNDATAEMPKRTHPARLIAAMRQPLVAT